MIAFSCPACNHLYEVGEDRVGTEATCLKCGQRMLVPSPTANQTRLGRPVQDADWHNQPPPPRVVPAPVEAYEEEEHEDERPSSPSPYYPYWMSDEAVEKALERRREFHRRVLDVILWVIVGVPAVFLVLMLLLALAMLVGHAVQARP
jgi:hypothetical protein